MTAVRYAFKLALGCLLVTSGIAAAGVAMMFAVLVLIGLVEWTGAPEAVRHDPVRGTVADSRADHSPERKRATVGVPTQVSQRPAR